jgi:hypothetical protein
MAEVTIAIQIGNSDDKLSQEQWSSFVGRINLVLQVYTKVHFFGGSNNWAVWQNIAWVVVCPMDFVTVLKQSISAIGREYNQDSVAWLQGSTEFI